MILRTAAAIATLSHFPPKLLLRHKIPSLSRILSLSTDKSRPMSVSSVASVESPESLASTSISPGLHYPDPIIDPGYLLCSLPEKKPLKVAVLVSGGVDSSVALRLLHAAGHSCTAFYLKIWFQEDFENFWSECPWEDDLKYAKAVCNQVDIPLEIVHLTEEYWNNVVSHIIDEYRNGRTPNPDVLCNTRIKFGAFVDAIDSMKFDFIASGHYAKVVHPDSGSTDETSTLELSKDTVKDQTYFLSHLSQSQLKMLVFPLGDIPKEEVRRIAKVFKLPNQVRKDSQGICFLGKIKFSEFVARHIGEKEGVILEAETGDFLGKHRGFWFYTIGQRQGLRLPGGPWYVVEKDVKYNVVFVSRNYFSVDKKRRIFRVGSLRWFSGSCPRKITQLQCKVRHSPNFYKCGLEIEVDENEHEIAVVELSEDDQGLAAGQFAAFYQDSICIGSGVILESWDDKGYPVCSRAIEVARMEDKSKLGKPVKIKVKPENPKREFVSELNLTPVDLETSEKMSSPSERISSYQLKWLQQIKDIFLQVF